MDEHGQGLLPQGLLPAALFVSVAGALFAVPVLAYGLAEGLLFTGILIGFFALEVVLDDTSF